MKHRKDGSKLYIKVEQNLNLITTRQIERLAEEARAVYLDLSDARIVDSEGVVLLYHLLRAGKELHLKEAPDILREILQALDLEAVIPIDRLSTTPFEV